MEKERQLYRFTWEGIEIEVSYSPREFNVMAWLCVKSIRPAGAPLPISQTGFRSHYHPPGTVEALGGDVVAQVRAWLDEEAAKPAWKRHVETHRQGELF